VNPDDSDSDSGHAIRSDDEAVAPVAAKAARPKARSHEWIILIVLTVLGTFLIRTYVVQSYRIPSESMENTLHGCTPHCNNDRILVDKLSYRFHNVHRGDVVVFKATGKWATVVNGDVVKRAIGLPGDVVKCCDAQGRVVVNGKSLSEPCVFQDDHMPFGPVTVPKGELWVMGDHRSDSSDSRYNGPVPLSSVVGHAFMRVWPLSRIGTLH
jgi:signal peptidase I